jgi:hypothetical protein
VVFIAQEELMESGLDIEFNRKVKLARQIVSLACAVAALIIILTPEIKEVRYVAVYAACSVYFLYNSSKTQIEEEEVVNDEWEGKMEVDGQEEEGEDAEQQEDAAHVESEPETQPEVADGVS